MFTSFAGNWSSQKRLPTDPPNYYIGMLASQIGVKQDSGRGVACDSLGNMYIIGHSNYAGNDDAIIVKYSASGVLEWQRKLENSGSDIGRRIVVDDSGNSYVVGSVTIAGAPRSSFLIKYDTFGTIQWQKILDLTGYYASQGGVSLDASGNVYIANGFYPLGAIIAKYNNSGTLQWQRQLGTSSGQCEIGNDSLGNAYITYAVVISNIQYTVIAKYNTSGNLQWQRRIANPTVYGVKADSSGNTYIIGSAYSSATSSNDIFIAKYDTAGNIQWQRTVGTGAYESMGNLALDAQGNIYICGYTDQTNSIIAKFNNSGTLQWQRSLASLGYDTLSDIVVDNSGSMYVTGNSDLNDYPYIVLARLPSDGSLMGSYTVNGYNFTYGISNLTSTVSTFTEEISSLAETSSNLVDAIGTLTDVAIEFTSSVTIL